VDSARSHFTVRAVAVLAAAALVGALAIGPVRADSAATKKSLDAALKKLHALEAEIAAENKTIAAMRADMQSLVDQIDKVQSEIALTQFKIVKKEAEIQDAQGQLDGTKEQLNQRAWVVYENGPGSSLDFLLGATSLSDLADRLVIVNSAATSDQDLIIQIQEEQNRLRSRQAELESLENDLRDKRTNLQDQQQQLQTKLDAEQVVLNKLDSNKAAADKLVGDLRTKYKSQLAAEEAARLAQLQNQNNADFKLYTGLEGCPVPGAVFSDDFGAPRYGGGFHLHAGNDLFAAKGTPIRAAISGTATKSPNGLGGNAVTISGSVGYVYNAHLDSYTGSFPRTVSAGEQVGTVGNSGDAQGSSPHDHFEFHPNNASQWPTWTSPYNVTQVGSAIDPYPFLRYRCG
jgi:peptidoglycan hydrolase CwlO-like protein